ncbi:MAG: methyltransferase domain-containing protein [Pseudomonadota bacterium]
MLPWRKRRKPFSEIEGDQDFLDALYRMLLGRPPDQGGLSHHLGRLQRGEADRADLLRDFVNSPECLTNRRVKHHPHLGLTDYVAVADPTPFLPYVQQPAFGEAQLCELTNPRKWLDQAWLECLRSMQIFSPALEDMHRKHYEYVQAAHGLTALGALGDEAGVLGVGAGHEILLYWLANRAGRVVGTDLYEGEWAQDNALEGDPEVIANPAKYAPFAYPQDRLSFRRMDGRRLEYDDATWDVVYSLSSIEHFGGHSGAAAAMAEMGRVLRPGGVAAVATELIVNGQRHPEFFSPADLLEYVVAPSGMMLVQPPVFELPAYVLDNPLHLPAERDYRPHLVLAERGLVYTSVILFFRKPAAAG